MFYYGGAIVKGCGGGVVVARRGAAARRQQGKAPAGGRRCLVPGCGKAALRGTGFCRDHRRTGLGAGEQRRLRQRLRDLTISAEVDEARLEAVFLRKARRGDYGELLDGAIRRIFAQSADERGLALALGALRVTLARVLGDERLGPVGRARA